MISICLPYFMRQRVMDRSLKAYQKLYGDLDVEISICDDGSPEILKDNVGTSLFVLVARTPTKDYALNPCVPINMAVNQSSGEHIVLTNPEVEHVKPILAQMREAIEHPLDYVIAACRDGLTGRWNAHSSSRSQHPKRAPYPAGSDLHFCVMFTRELWEKACGFDSDYRMGQAYDDNDWLWRAERAGARFIMRDDLITRHNVVNRCDWPVGGLARNRKLFKERWPDV